MRQTPSERKISLLPLGPHTRFLHAYARLTVALSQAKRSEEDLGPGRRQVAMDLHEPYHEYALAHLHDWWHYDQTKLMNQRFRRGAAKPRIMLKAFLTRPGNLAVEWEPDERNGSDWAHFYRLSGYGPYRPSNELMFIREVRPLHPNPRPGEYGQYHDRLVDAHLLACLGAAIKDLEDRLEKCFEVRWESSFVLDWAPVPKDRWVYSDKGHELLGWHIEDVVGREQREQRDELAELLKRMERDAAGFVDLLIEIDPEITLDALRSESTRVRVQKKLRARGIAMTPAPLAKLLALLEQHHSELLRPLWREAGGGLKVVK